MASWGLVVHSTFKRRLASWSLPSTLWSCHLVEWSGWDRKGWCVWRERRAYRPSYSFYHNFLVWPFAEAALALLIDVRRIIRDKSGANVTAITAGAYHTCVLFASREVVCWGQNSAGQLGIGSTTSVGTSAGQMGANLQKVDLGPGTSPLRLIIFSSTYCESIRLEAGCSSCMFGPGFGPHSHWAAAQRRLDTKDVNLLGLVHAQSLNIK